MIGEDFHLLGFDPRGVNGSIPQAVCFPNSEQRIEMFSRESWELDFQAGDMFTSAENTARACNETMGDMGAYINTPQTAADSTSTTNHGECKHSSRRANISRREQITLFRVILLSYDDSYATVPLVLLQLKSRG